MNKITLAIATAMFCAGLLLGSAHSVDAGHDKPCVTVTPTRTATVTRTPTPPRGPICAQLVGGKCQPPAYPTRSK